MSGNIKGITIEFRGDTTQLDKALKQVNSETKKIDKELNAVNKALKFNPKNVDLLRQKQTLLTQKIGETEDKLKLLKQQQEKMDTDEVDKNSAEYRQLQREIIETESKLKTFNNQLKQVDKTLSGMKMQEFSDKMKGIGEGLTKAGEAAKPLSMAGAAVAAGVGALAVTSGSAADDLNTLSKVTGIGTAELQKYKAASDLVDVSVETMAKTNQKLKKTMYSAANGGKSQAEAFDALGVSVTDSDGNLRDSEEVFQDVITALGQMENETERDALAQTVMGKSAAELNPLIADQGETYKKVADTLAKYDLEYVDQETLDNANAFNDSLDTMKAIGSVAISTIGTQLAGYLAPALEKAVDLFGRFAEWLGNLSPKVLTVIGVVGGLVAGIAPLLIILGKVAFAISSITGLMATAGLSFGAIAVPIGIAIAAIAAIIAIGVLLYKNWDKIKAKAQEFMKNVKIAWTKLKTDTVSKFNAIKTAMIKPFQDAWSKIKAIIGKIKSFFPIKIGNILSHIKLPHFKLTGKFSLKDMTVPHLSIDWYKTGGIFDSPSVIGVGEAGAEAVVPLDKFWNKLDNLQGGQNIVININGANADPREIANEVKKVLIRETKSQRLAWQ